ncbi:hypothetical protein cypCar_00047314 [Cyprinus carpio]|nr:hypothetical protein cypCar_00047314 [Cyprinus carpio]
MRRSAGPDSSALTEVSDASLLGGWQDVWLFRLFLNVLGYATIIIPGYFLISYFKRINYLETGRGICFPVIKTCVFGSESKTGLLDDVSPAARNESESSSSARQAVKLIFCAAGLQVSYLTWGVLQERVMTRSYGASEVEGSGERFRDSQFLVFMNRILALTVSGLWCVLLKQPRHGAPMYKYSFASLSNILSSWCQYEALKYISFPTQMMFGSQSVSRVFLDVGSLLEQGAFFDSLAFIMASLRVRDARRVLLSVCSACGQLFIFYTISQFRRRPSSPPSIIH